MVSKRVGVIGGGQLAWMMAAPAQDLGIEMSVQTPNPTDPAAAIAHQVIFAPVGDATATAQLAAQSDVITFENEFVDLAALRPLADRGVLFYPTLDNLAPLLDKYEQRQYLSSLNLPVPRFFPILHPSDFNLKRIPFSFPLVLKVRRHGYDGQGTFIVGSAAELGQLQEQLQGLSLMVEEFIPYDRELAVIAVRSLGGEVGIYPVVETQQENQVCRRVIVPAPVSQEVQRKITEIARYLVQELEYVGVMGIEFFLGRDGSIFLNEIAPRTHNSGHYTIDACSTSQFAMQLRAITGLPLPPITLKTAGAVMVNLLGYEHSTQDYGEKRARMSAFPLTYLHWYGKKESRLGRKLGHITILASADDNRETLLAKAKTIEDIWYRLHLGQDSPKIKQ